jgi:hypothetical protein
LAIPLRWRPFPSPLSVFRVLKGRVRPNAILTRQQLAWIIAFVSSIISATSGLPDARFPNYAWWTLVFMFFCIIGVTVTVASEAERTYHVAVSRDCLRDGMHLLI